MWQLLGFAGGILVLVGYFISIRFNRPPVLDWANVFGSLMMIYPNIYFKAYFGVMLTSSFGMIAAYSLLRRRKADHE